MAMKHSDEYARLEEALEVVSELKMPPHLEAVAFEYLLSAGHPQAQSRAPAITPTANAAPSAPSDLRAFIAAAKPTSSVSEIPALLYWARAAEKKDAVNEKDVIELYRRAGMRPPKDVTQSFRDLCKKKYMRLEPVQGARGAYRLSRVGEDFVLHDLLAKRSD